MKEMQTISHDPLTDRVTRAIQEMILHGEVMPGERLPTQHELAARFGVGLSTVREAIKGLTLIGLVEPRAGRGTVVLPDALQDPQQHHPLMKANLGLAGGRSGAGSPPVDRRRAHPSGRHARQMRTSPKSRPPSMRCRSVNDPAAFVRADLHFHMAVARASKNDVLMQTYYLIQSLIEEVVRLADALPGGQERAMVNHTQILEGIKRHDPEFALAAAERQIADAIEFRGKGG